MRFLKRFTKALSKVMNEIKRAFDMIIFYQKSLYHIEEIDVEHHRLLIHSRGTRVVMKTTFELVVNDDKIIAGLSPIQACLVGGYYGRALRASQEGRDSFKKPKNTSFLLKNNRGQYKIIFQNRLGEIGYIDQKTRKEYVASPLQLANDACLISKFDSSQACYIGILAGISLEKVAGSSKAEQNCLDKLLDRSPKLRIVK